MPGLLQGLQTGYSYPDAASTWIETRDCGLLTNYYGTAAGKALPEHRQGCHQWPSSRLLQRLDSHLHHTAKSQAANQLRPRLSGSHHLRPANPSPGRALLHPRHVGGGLRYGARRRWQHQTCHALRQRRRAIRTQGHCSREPLAPRTSCFSTKALAASRSGLDQRRRLRWPAASRHRLICCPESTAAACTATRRISRRWPSSTCGQSWAQTSI